MTDRDADFLVWSERQASILRSLRRKSHGLPIELDVESVAAEIESVGRAELQSVASLVRLMLLQLIKMVDACEPYERLAHIEDIDHFHAEVAQRLTPSMASRIDIARLWRRAVSQSRRAAREERRRPLPAVCPIPLDALLTDAPLDIAALEARLRRAASD